MRYSRITQRVLHALEPPLASQPGHSKKWPGTDCLRMRVISVTFSVKRYRLLTSFKYGMLYEPRIRPVVMRVCLETYVRRGLSSAEQYCSLQHGCAKASLVLRPILIRPGDEATPRLALVAYPRAATRRRTDDVQYSLQLFRLEHHSSLSHLTQGVRNSLAAEAYIHV